MRGSDKTSWVPQRHVEEIEKLVRRCKLREHDIFSTIPFREQQTLSLEL